MPQLCHAPLQLTALIPSRCCSGVAETGFLLRKALYKGTKYSHTLKHGTQGACEHRAKHRSAGLLVSGHTLPSISWMKLGLTHGKHY